jgi:hypothetical protein
MATYKLTRADRFAVRRVVLALVLVLVAAPVGAYEDLEATAIEPQFPQQQSAGDLLRTCASSRLTASGRERRRYCAGFVSGVEEAVRLLGMGRAKDMRLGTPDDVTAATLADAFMRYGASHDNQLAEPAAGVVLYALAEAYPCVDGGP